MKNLLPLTKVALRFIGYPTRSLVTVPTERLRLLSECH